MIIVHVFAAGDSAGKRAGSGSGLPTVPCCRLVPVGDVLVLLGVSVVHRVAAGGPAVLLLLLWLLLHGGGQVVPVVDVVEEAEADGAPVEVLHQLGGVLVSRDPAEVVRDLLLLLWLIAQGLEHDRCPGALIEGMNQAQVLRRAVGDDDEVEERDDLLAHRAAGRLQTAYLPHHRVLVRAVPIIRAPEALHHLIV
jgi:hypothetical protein